MIRASALVLLPFLMTSPIEVLGVRWSTYLGGDTSTPGPPPEEGHAVCIDTSGNIYVTGLTNSTDFPTLGGFDATHNGSADVFVTKYTALGVVVWSTHLGSFGGDVPYAIAVDGLGAVVVAGYTGSSAFPTTNGFKTTIGGAQDQCP